MMHFLGLHYHLDTTQATFGENNTYTLIRNKTDSVMAISGHLFGNWIDITKMMPYSLKLAAINPKLKIQVWKLHNPYCHSVGLLCNFKKGVGQLCNILGRNVL